MKAVVWAAVAVGVVLGLTICAKEGSLHHIGRLLKGLCPGVNRVMNPTQHRAPFGAHLSCFMLISGHHA